MELFVSHAKVTHCDPQKVKATGESGLNVLIYNRVFGRGGGIRTRDPLHPMQGSKALIV